MARSGVSSEPPYQSTEEEQLQDEIASILTKQVIERAEPSPQKERNSLLETSSLNGQDKLVVVFHCHNISLEQS